MREILFRGKRIDNGEWTYGFVEVYDDGACFITKPNGEGDKVDPTTVGQYTGLNDKNRKKIFEGDIVSGFFNHEKIVGYIFYGSDASFFIQRDGLFGIGLNNASDWLEVIGNIHDNPELLEVTP